MRRNYFFYTFLVASTLMNLLPTVAEAAPTIGDYDNDGTSDISFVQVERSLRKTFWYVRRSNGTAPLSYVFDVPGDALISGRFYSGGHHVYPGVVWVRDANRPLEWYIKNPAGGENQLFFGTPGDTVPNQGDVDCDGVTDLIVARNGTANLFPGSKLWYIARTGQPGAIQQLTYGVPSDRVATADIDGDGCSELILLRSDFTWIYRKLYQPTDTTVSVQWGLAGDIPLLPQDFTGDGVADFIISRVDGGIQKAYVRGSSDGSALVFPLGLAPSVPMVGNFVGQTGFAWYNRQAATVGIPQLAGWIGDFPYGRATDIIVRPDGTVIQPTETSGINSSSGSSSSSSASSNNNNNNNSGDGPRCSFTIKGKDGSGGFVNNPDNSKGTMKVIFPKAYTGDIREVKVWHDGRVFDTFRNGGSLEWGERERYYGRKSLGSYPNNVVVTADLDDGRVLCVTVTDPQSRQD